MSAEHQSAAATLGAIQHISHLILHENSDDVRRQGLKALVSVTLNHQAASTLLGKEKNFALVGILASMWMRYAVGIIDLIY